jgi:hypothetical protein
MDWTRTKIVVALAAFAVLVAGVATGRHLLAGNSNASSAAMSAPAAGRAVAPVSRHGAVNTAAAPSAHAASGTAGAPSDSGSGLPDVPVSAVTPQVVHTATIEMRVGKGRLASVLQSMASLAGTEGGYVDRSSMSGGTAQRSPVAGTVVFRVPDVAFSDAIATVAGLGTVEDQSITGKDVTVASAQNAASIAVLQDEATLLDKRLAEATDTNTFLQIEGQFVPVEQQLQQLQSAQDVLQNSAALATVTVNLTAPGAPVQIAAAPRANAAAGALAWRYLRHNSLAVVDGLAVAFGWALPVLVLLALVGSIALRVIRRRRHAITPA